MEPADDYKGAKVLLEELPEWMERLAADKGHDAGWVRNVLESMGIEPCISGKKNRLVEIEYDHPVTCAWYFCRHIACSVCVP